MVCNATRKTNNAAQPVRAKRLLDLLVEPMALDRLPKLGGEKPTLKLRLKKVYIYIYI